MTRKVMSVMALLLMVCGVAQAQTTMHASANTVVEEWSAECPEGPLNIVAPNYLNDETNWPPDECGFSLRFEREDRFDPSGWVTVDEMSTGIGNIHRAHKLAWRALTCGVVVQEFGGWEDFGTVYTGTKLRVRVERLPPC